MIRRLSGVAILSVFFAGCGETTPEADSEAATALSGPISPSRFAVPIEAGTVDLNPEDVRIDFVGSKPDGSSHTGGFRQFSGSIQVNPETKAPTSIAVTIETDSIYTDNERLTGHLKTPDFFDVRQYPEATFQSTAIESSSDGVLVTGDLTLHGVTNSISFPSQVEVTDKGLMLTSEFTIDRLAFGMDYQPDGINKDVALTVSVGQSTPRPTPVAAQADGGGGPSGGPGGFGRPGGFGGPGGPGGPGGGFDPQAIFAQRDADGDGKLTGDEISERMRGRLEEIDTDGDGAVTLEEFQASMSRFRQGGPGGGPGGAGGGPGGPGGPEPR